jgi:hypothetical protein
VNCKFFKKDFFTMTKFAKCTLFPKVQEEDSQFYVTGIPEKKPIEYDFCSVLRMYECGKEGKNRSIQGWLSVLCETHYQEKEMA